MKRVWRGESGTILPRLIATDLDGTLLRSDGSLSTRTAAALRLAARAGIPVVPATARPLRWLADYPLLRAAYRVVFANGAVVYDPRGGAVVARHLLTPPALAGLVRQIVAAVPVAVFAVEPGDGRLHRHQPTYPVRSDLRQLGVAPAELPELVAEPAIKLLVKAPGMATAELLARVVAAAGRSAEASVSALDGPVELAAPGVTKATGLAAVAAELGVPPAGVVAFGDMPNDLPMLAWAGYAVAVGNAHPDVLAVADEVVGSNDQDGVASWIEARCALGQATA
ncbi:MAG: HAD family hydrolase, partial [Natronosporangium sp.]